MTIMKTVILSTNRPTVAGFGFFGVGAEVGYLFGLQRNGVSIIMLRIDEISALNKMLEALDQIQRNTDLLEHTINVSSRMKLIWDRHQIKISDIMNNQEILFSVGCRRDPEERREKLSALINDFRRALFCIYAITDGGPAVENVDLIFDAINERNRDELGLVIFSNNQRTQPSVNSITLAAFYPPINRAHDEGGILFLGNVHGLYHRYVPEVEALEEIRDAIMNMMGQQRKEHHTREQFVYKQHFESIWSLAGIIGQVVRHDPDGPYWECLLANITQSNNSRCAFRGDNAQLECICQIINESISMFKKSKEAIISQN